MAIDAARDSSKTGLVIAAHGRRGMLETTEGSALPYIVRGRHLQVCCGDHVHWQAFADGDPVVVSGTAPRMNQLNRQPPRGSKPETIAANISHLIVVMAALPLPDLFITDRYLCAAHLMGVKAAIVWNKADLAALPETELAVYSRLGYRLFPVSAVTGTGLDALLGWAGQCVGLLVGQSGVGKSSLLNRLVPGSDTATGQLSAANDEGRHTTTASIMYRLENGGRLIDTPGVRDFVPAIPRSARHRTWLHRDRHNRSRLSLCRLQSPAGTGLRGERSRPERHHRQPALRELSTAHESRQPGDWPGLLISTDPGARRNGVRQGTGIHILEFTAHRHAMCDTRGANPAFLCDAGQITSGRLTLYRGTGGENQLTRRTIGKLLLKQRNAKLCRTDAIQRREPAHQHKVPAAITA